MLGGQQPRPAGRRNYYSAPHAGRPLEALTRVVHPAMPGRMRRQTSAIEWLMWRLEGRQVDVQGLGGSAVAVTAGVRHCCALMVRERVLV